MSDPVVDIEVQLRQAAVEPEQMIDRRKKLHDLFASLSQDQAVGLLSLLFTWDNKSRLQWDFRTLHRAIRLELLSLLTAKLGSQTAENFKAAFEGRTKTPLLKGLKLVFPDSAKAERDKFLKTLVRGAPTGVPSISLLFRNRGRFSPDNQAPSLTKPGFTINALGPIKGQAINQMEIRGTVKGHRADAEYKFERTINNKTWYLSGKSWKWLDAVIPPGTNDNTHVGDEDDFPDNDHIYSIDTPGFTGPETAPDLVDNVPSADRSTLWEAVFMLNATETVKVRVAGGNWGQAAQLDWFSVTWLERVDGVWRRKSGSNRIAEGSIENLEDADTPDNTNF